MQDALGEKTRDDRVSLLSDHCIGVFKILKKYYERFRFDKEIKRLSIYGRLEELLD